MGASQSDSLRGAFLQEPEGRLSFQLALIPVESQVTDKGDIAPHCLGALAACGAHRVTDEKLTKQEQNMLLYGIVSLDL